jgi:hypothetical protein
MVTTIIAIYGAVLSTVSALLGVWYFLRSGPRLQAEAHIFPPVDDCSIELRVWNTGRSEITVNIDHIVIRYDKNKINLLMSNRDLNGPEVPTRILDHSGESWTIGMSDIRSVVGEAFTSATFSVVLVVGGKREVNVPVLDGSFRWIKRRFILKPGSSQPD